MSEGYHGPLETWRRPPGLLVRSNIIREHCGHIVFDHQALLKRLEASPPPSRPQGEDGCMWTAQNRFRTDLVTYIFRRE